MRQKNSKKKKKTRSGLVARLLKILVVGGVAAGSVGAAALALAFWHYSNDPSLPKVEMLRSYVPQQSVTVVDRDGRVLAKVGKFKRTALPYSRYPEVMIHAVLAAEDAHFFEHRGINLLGMVRAFFVNLRAGRMRQGGSTITQQVVKNILLTPERTLRRKIQEVILARRLENELPKERILELYLNQVYVGHGRYGMEEGALFYFGKHVWELEVHEAALLAGLVQGPELLSPFKHPDRARKRRQYVLRQMARHGWITDKELERALEAPLPEKPHELGSDQAPEVVEYVTRHIAIKQAGGKTVRTTVDLRLQEAARKALRRGLRSIDRRLGVTRLRRIRKPRKLAGGVMLGRICCRRGKDVVVELPDGTKGIIVDGFDRYYPKGFDWVERIGSARSYRKILRKHKKPVMGPSLGVRVREVPGRSPYRDAPKRLKLELGPEGAVVLLALPSAEILALVGGYEAMPGMFDRATQALRQPGSTMKPFVYALAIESKSFTPASVMEDSPTVQGKWIPRSHSRYMGRVTLRTALAHSLNSVAVQLAKRVGVSRLVKLLRSLGITSKLSPDLTLALGASSVRPIELAGAYTVFPLLGLVQKPWLIAAVGQDKTDPPAPVRVLSPQTAWIMISMLRSVVEEGTGRRALRLPFRVAGKTGTTNRSKDAWFVGFNPHFLCAVWVGYDDGKPMGRHIAGSSGALPVFMDVMKAAMATYHKKDSWFPMPGRIETQLVDKKTGKAVRPGTPGAIREYFIQGTAPEPPPIEEPAEATSMEDVGNLMMQ